METIAWVGFSQGLFAAILIRAKRSGTDPDKILAGWLALLAIEFLLHAFDYRFLGRPLLSSSFLLFNPACYLYLRSLTSENFRLKWLQLLHLLPYLALKLIAYIIREPYELDSYFEHDSNLWFRVLFSTGSVLSWIIYNTKSILLVINHRKSLKHEFSTIESSNKVNWMLFVVVFYNLYCLAAVIIGTVSVLTGSDSPVMHIYSYSTLLLMIYLLGFYGLWQTSIYPEKDTAADTEAKYSRYPLSGDRKKQIKAELISFFEMERPYLNPDLNMNIMSDRLDIPKHHLTEVLSTEIGKNFFTFVNEYRIGAVKELLAGKGHLYSVESIGFECGFNSKSTFFTVFKKMTGKTPMQYLSGTTE